MIGCVVLNYNDADTTLDLLKRIEPMEIIDQIVLVDNKSTDNSLERLKEQESNKVHVVCAKKNGGYGSGNNVGIEYLRKNYSCDYIIIANPDVIFDESVIKKMINEFDEDTVIVAPLTLNSKKERQLPIAWKVPTVKDYFLFSSIVLNKIFKPFQYPTQFFNTDICEVDCVQGCLFMLNNSLIEDKLYDENIFLFFEESCIGKQFKDKGYKTKLLMNVDYIHNHSVSINKAFNSEARKRKITLDSFYTYFEDYYSLSGFTKGIMRIYKKFIYIENYILLKIFFN
ncbi:glycosyltransferase family 2 protein [Holdemanella biformis]|uniref:glycosyltransferase family 2 protein n=1 Tax=Holdemanella biformis TaxID=1735 RepID=UPI001C2652F0|nr:glycosyltransferase family 2 protein [Holdemanella biformis]MBU9895654.1 glycosyltransferase family 2 protein [Holdemanella biformis]MBV3416115.1 glycosyltransferase family 2 protein [Holdemanella biformis]